jgi:hypothetical protein
MSGLSDGKKWEVYMVYLSQEYFLDDARPDPLALGNLLEDLGVTLAQVEHVIGGEELVPGAGEGQASPPVSSAVGP